MNPRNKKREAYFCLAIGLIMAALSYLIAITMLGPDVKPVVWGVIAFASFCVSVHTMKQHFDKQALVDSADLYREETLNQQKQ